MTCQAGDNLRRVLMAEGIDLYNGRANIINCMGIGTCGTCAVQIEGEESERNWKEKGRLSFPPHNSQKPLRLACQITVTRDLKITKYEGFWGQGDRPQWTSLQG